MVDIPETIYASKQVVSAWNSISVVHNMFFDQDVPKQGFLLYGKSGMGKTFILKQYSKLFQSRATRETNTIPVLYLAIARNAKSIDDIPQLLLNELGAPPLQKKLSSICLERQLVTMLREKKVELIMLDEIQNLNTSYDGLEFQKVIKYFCFLLDREDVKCSIVFAGSEYAKRIMSFGETGKKLQDGEHLLRRLLRPSCLIPIKPKSQQWVDCINWFLSSIALPEINHNEEQDFLNRLYIAYHERAMSSLRDLFMRANSRKAGSLETLKDCIFTNFEIYGKSDINPFCEHDLSNEEAAEMNTDLLTTFKRLSTISRNQARAAIS